MPVTIHAFTDGRDTPPTDSKVLQPPLPPPPPSARRRAWAVVPLLVGDRTLYTTQQNIWITSGDDAEVP